MVIHLLPFAPDNRQRAKRVPMWGVGHVCTVCVTNPAWVCTTEPQYKKIVTKKSTEDFPCCVYKITPSTDD